MDGWVGVDFLCVLQALGQVKGEERERGEEAGEGGRRGREGAREREASHGGISARGSARSALAPKGFKRGEDNLPLLSSGEHHRRPRMHKCKMRNARSPCPPKAK